MYKSMEDIRKAVDDGHGYLVITMQELKEAFEVKRCSSGNLEKISRGIKGFGFNHLPQELPNNQGDRVTIVYDHNIPRNQFTDRSSNSPARPAEVVLVENKRFGNRWNDFGEPPSEMEYTAGQLTNARASRNYSLLHGRRHPYSAHAKDSYEKAVERCFACEMKVFELYQDTDCELPDELLFEYFYNEEMPQNLIGQAPEGNSVITGYVIKGFGKLNVGKGVKLPISIPKTKNK